MVVVVYCSIRMGLGDKEQIIIAASINININSLTAAKSSYTVYKCL